jgi:hypothetical protein
MAWKNENTQAQNNTQSDNKNKNVVVDITLKCWEQKEGFANGAILLKCGFGGGKKDNGEYRKEIPIAVWVNPEKCKIKPDNYERTIISVCGRLGSNEYTDKEGKTKAGLTINAEQVIKLF